MIDYSLILSTNYIDKQWSLLGNSYDGIEWHDDSLKPTQAELDAQWQPLLDKLSADQEAKATAKDSALAKLSKLGLTENEIKALVG
jgi:hypothetical protein